MADVAKAQNLNSEEELIGGGKKGSSHLRYQGDVAVYGNGDTARAGEDTTDPGVHNGPNVVGTTIDPEEAGLEINDAYKAAVGRGGKKARTPEENK